MSELKRREVKVFMKPHGTKLRIMPKTEGSFALYDDSNAEVASSLSDSALANWAFDYGGAFEVRFDYDLAKGDMAK